MSDNEEKDVDNETVFFLIKNGDNGDNNIDDRDAEDSDGDNDNIKETEVESR